MLCSRRHRPLRFLVFGLLAGSLALAACGGSATDSETPAPTASDAPVTVAAASPTAEPTTAAETPTPESTPEATESPTEAPATGTAAAEVLAPTFAAWEQVESLRMKMTMPGSDASGETLQMVMEMVRPDRMRVSMETAEGTFEMIIIGDVTYMNLGGTWTELPGPQDLSTYGALSPDEPIDEVSAPDVTVVQSGTETIDGVTCTVWDLTIPDEEAGTMTGRIWVGADDNLPRRMVFETPEGPMTVEYSGYNEDITIEPPI